MLLPENVHPESCLYFNGAYVLQALKLVEEVGLMDLYVESRKLREMPMPVFVLVLDWLFLADLVDYTPGGKIRLCS